MTTHTETLNPAQIQHLRQLLEERGWALRPAPHAHYAATGPGLQIVAYTSGKCLIQGKGTRDFLEYTLEPLILQNATLGYEELHHPETYQEHIGVDESGKGDFFGPLVITAVHATSDAIRTLLQIGVKDSKRLTSERATDALYKNILATPGITHETIELAPAKYNQLQRQMRTVNQVLGWGHATVARELLARFPGCRRAVFDQFARDTRLILRYLGTAAQGRDIVQRHKAEQDPVVAAASIIARRTFLKAIAKLSQQAGEKIPLGASAQVKATAQRLLQKLGRERLATLVKTHFKTWNELHQATLHLTDSKPQ